MELEGVYVSYVERTGDINSLYEYKSDSDFSSAIKNSLCDKKEISTLTLENMRCIDKLFRLGGDEFIVLLSKSGIEDSTRLAERLKNEINSFDFSCEKLTCSFGVTEIKDEDTIDSILKRSDEALYTSKNRGKNCISKK